MKRSSKLVAALAVLAGGLVVGQAAGVASAVSEGDLAMDLPLTNSCAVFNKYVDATTTRIVYGEDIDFKTNFHVVRVLEATESGVSLKFQVTAHADGIGRSSGIGYVFNGKASLKANVSDVSRFKGTFALDARLIGKGNDGSQGTLAQGAQDNATLHYKISVDFDEAADRLAVSAVKTDFSIECMGSPWSNQMTAVNTATKKPVGRGFGDVWNKYAWSMKDFNGGMLVGTKNASFDYQQLASPDPAVGACMASPDLALPSIYKVLACAELFDSGATKPSAQTRYAEIWRFDYTKKTWTRSLDDTASQGFRVMAQHGTKMYAGSDLGSFVAGIKLGSLQMVEVEGAQIPTWEFPGVALLSSLDGKTWSNVTCSTAATPVDGTPASPCHDAGARAPFGKKDVNISIRSLASFNNKLYVGTFNLTGAELWELDGSTWSLVNKFPAVVTGVTELRVMGNQLLFGLGGVTSGNGGLNLGTMYLGTMSADKTLALVPGLPDAGGTLGVLKLFVSSKGTLFIGLADVTDDENGTGFEMYSWAGGSSTTFNPVTMNGFGNPENAYAWSMNEINGRLLLGTFNSDFFNELPRGSGELWYSDDNGVNWQQMAMPLDWGSWNYGIRNLEIGNKQLFLGSASNMVAPDLTTNLGLPLSPGAEVWTIRTGAVAPVKK